ncbi:glycosyl hydrolase, family 31 [Dictyocaulus viviparus]|uniref:Glycosyl hydrolase, family 31 n=1 Tax=Dictyocaulus viviparus TaxID=29172 RepID=A0A0D8XP80_DICVI|nr:glycosyl hydrolase, family 31 [Dictyocaulus viviparus]
MRNLLILYAIHFVHGVQIRMDCHPEIEATQENCEERDCIWSPPPDSDTINLKKNDGHRNPWGTDIDEIYFTSDTIGKTLNIKISAHGRYEPPIDLPRQLSTSSDTLMVVTNVVDDVFYFIVKRKSSGRALFNTSIGGLIFSDKFIQLATYLPSDTLYGLGENVHQTLKHNFSTYRTWGMLARDEPPNSAFLDTKNLYGLFYYIYILFIVDFGVHPFYMMLEPDGNAHGVLILNSNAQEVTTAPGPSLIYRTIGGNLDLYFFPGPTPEEVTQQYLALIGRPFLPAYWALGYQLSRYGYKDLNDMKNIVDRNIKAGIPMDTAVVDIDYMDRYKDFTIGKDWAELSAYVEHLHNQGIRTILIYDPAIEVDYESFERGINASARFIEWERDDQVMREVQDKYPLAAKTKIMLGVVWPDRHVAFPDFLDTTGTTTKWWIQEFVGFWKKVPYDGIWIDMNEPSNFGTNERHPWYFEKSDHSDLEPLMCPTRSGSKDSEWDMPPYQTHSVYNYGKDAYLATKTLCMMAVQANGTQRFFNVKNLYGWSEAKATQQALHVATGKRGAVISRSTFPSIGRFAGHWLGDNSASWEDLQTSVIGAQEFNMFGIPYVGSDICGFNGETNEQLCLRWQQMGAFHSFMRNHNSDDEPPQDPARWPSVTAATIKANRFRYTYLPYLFSLHFIASMIGGTVVRPLFYEYPKDQETHNLGHQFLWGPIDSSSTSSSSKQLLHLTLLTQHFDSVYFANFFYNNFFMKDVASVKVYLPNDDWYSLYDYNYGQPLSPGYQTFPAPLTSLIPVFVRGGSILPRQAPNVTTKYSRQNPFELLIAPGIYYRNESSTVGVLFWDDGESIVNSYKTHNFYHWLFKYYEDCEGAYLSIKTERKATSLVIPTLDTLEIFNYKYFPDFNSFTLNGRKINVDVQSSSYQPFTKILSITTRNFIDLSKETISNLSWKHSTSMKSIIDYSVHFN